MFTYKPHTPQHIQPHIQQQQKDIKKNDQSVFTNLSKKKQNYFQVAVNSALKSPMLMTLGACLVVSGKVISTGYNYYRSRILGITSASTHAEVSTLFQSLTRKEKKYRFKKWQKYPDSTE
jgi:deoxycytidylate deaminase